MARAIDVTEMKIVRGTATEDERRPEPQEVQVEGVGGQQGQGQPSDEDDPGGHEEGPEDEPTACLGSGDVLDDRMGRPRDRGAAALGDRRHGHGCRRSAWRPGGWPTARSSW